MQTKISINMYEKENKGVVLLFFSKVSIMQYSDDRTLPYITINMEVGSSTEPYGAVSKEDAEDRVHCELREKLNMINLFGVDRDYGSIMRVSTKWRKINARK